MIDIPIRILYIDDSPLDRALVRDALMMEAKGFELIEATSRQQVEALLDSERYDVVLSDLNILGYSGLQVLEAVQTSAPQIPIIIVTGTGSEEVAVEALKRGAADYIVKSGRSLRHLPHSIQLVLEHQRAERAVRESERRYRALFEQMNDAIFIIGLDGNFIDVNQRGCDMLGYTHDELIKFSFRETSAETDQSEQVIARLLEGKNVPVYERMFRKKDGDLVPAEINAQLVRDLDGNSLYIQSIARDITERKRTAESIKAYSENLEEMVSERTRQLQDAHERLIRQERLAALGELAGSVGHELRNPLGVITSAVYYLRIVLAERSEEVDQSLDLIEKEARNAANLVSDLLEYARIKLVNRLPVVISDSIAQALAKNPPPDNVIVSSQIPAELPAVLVDPRQLEQVLVNLVTNAYQAMPQGGRLSIGLCESSNADSDPSMVVLCIQDTGKGIEPENIDKIFEPLFTTKARGIGLGLAISKKLIEANQGRIKVESELGVGTTFRVYLPISR
jgi:PAS domain S-box-containing protein